VDRRQGKGGKAFGWKPGDRSKGRYFFAGRPVIQAA